MTHEFNAEEYRKASTHQKEWGLRILSELDLHGDERILDLGCGDGVLTAQLAALTPRGNVLGIDSSQNMITAALQLKQPNLDFKVEDISSISYVEEFDLIFSNAALHWVLDHHDCLHKVNRGLKKGGFLRTNFAGEGNCATLFRVVQTVMRQGEFQEAFRSFTWPWYMPGLTEYRQLIQELPFSEILVKGENADRYFADAESLVRWIDQPSLVPFLAVIPSPQKQSFRDQVVSMMLEATRQSDGRHFETFRRIDVIARK